MGKAIPSLFAILWEKIYQVCSLFYGIRYTKFICYNMGNDIQSLFAIIWEMIYKVYLLLYEIYHSPSLQLRVQI